MRPHVELVAAGARVEQLSHECWQAHVTWYQYCRQHGYPRGKTPADYPPKPTEHHGSGRCECAHVTYRWATVRDWIEQAIADERLDLFAEGAA